MYPGGIVEDVAGEIRVSSRGQLSLPAQARHRWGLGDGGAIGWVDLGDLLVLVPGGAAAARAALLEAIDPAAWADAGNGFGDPDLANG